MLGSLGRTLFASSKNPLFVALSPGEDAFSIFTVTFVVQGFATD